MRSSLLAVAFVLVGCAPTRLDRLSNAYTALYVVATEQADGQEDLQRLDRVEACWRSIYVAAKAAFDEETRRARERDLYALLTRPDKTLAGTCALYLSGDQP